MPPPTGRQSHYEKVEPLTSSESNQSSGQAGKSNPNGQAAGSLYCDHAAELIPGTVPLDATKRAVLASMTRRRVETKHLIEDGLLAASLAPTTADTATWAVEHRRVEDNKSLSTLTRQQLDLVLKDGIEPFTTYSLSTIMTTGQPWADAAVTYLRRANRKSRRKKTKDKDRVQIRDLFACHLAGLGATPAELRALPKADTDSDDESADIIDQWDAEDRFERDAKARAAVAARRNGSAALPEATTLTELLAEADEDAEYRIDRIWPTGGRVLLAAQYKSGKTTLVGNAVRVLVDGGEFLGRFATTTVRRVVLIDTELDRRTVRRWLRDQGIRNTDAVTVIPLRGAVSAFDILDPAKRAKWVALIGKTDVLILDCLRPVLDALNLSEATEAGRVLTAFDELMAEVRATEGMVVTHMGHQNERARGDSRLRDWNDAEWTLVRDGNDNDDDADRTRFLSALGRDVSLPEGQLTFDPATRHLSYEGGNRVDQPVRAATPVLLGLVRNEPGLSKAEVERRLGADHEIPQNVARAAIKAALRVNPPLLIVTPGEHGAHRLSVPPGSPFDVPASG